MAPKSNRNQIVKTGHNNSADARDFPTVNKYTPGMQYLRRWVEIAFPSGMGHPVPNPKDGTSARFASVTWRCELYHQNPA